MKIETKTKTQTTVTENRTLKAKDLVSEKINRNKTSFGYRTDPFTKKKFIPNRRNQKFENSLNKMSYNNNLASKKREKESKNKLPKHKSNVVLCPKYSISIFWGLFKYEKY